jgi:hypothetical protein
MKTIDQRLNEVIAAFMGAFYHDDKAEWYDWKGLYMGDSLRFHSSWSWLMPVIEEISLRKRIDESYMGIVTIYGLNRTGIQCYHNERLVKTIDTSDVTGIEATYKAVVEFIEWYNESKAAPQPEPAKEEVHQLTPQEFIEKYRAKLEHELHRISRDYILRKAEGTVTGSLYSPRWYNIEDIVETIEDDMEAPLRVSFKSTQGPMYFSIQVPREDMEALQYLHMDLWDPFKRFRTKFLEENYPTINTY